MVMNAFAQETNPTAPWSTSEMNWKMKHVMLLAPDTRNLYAVELMQ